jgi:hypothetical protein
MTSLRYVAFKIIIKIVVTMPRCKPKRQTTYLQRYSALSALGVHTIGKVQHIWTLCVLHLKLAEQLFAFCLLLDLVDDFIMLMMMLLHHCIKCVQFFNLLDNLLMDITPDQVIPHLVPANHHCTFDLLHPGWCYQFTRFRVLQLQELYHLLEFPALFALSNRGHYGSSEEAFITTVTKLATGHSNVMLADNFGFSRDGMVLWLCESIWHQSTNCPLPKWDNWVPLWSHFRTQEQYHCPEHVVCFCIRRM